MQIESSIYNVYGYTIIFVHLHSFNFFVYYAFRTSNISTRFNTPTTFSTFSFCRMSIRIYPFLWKLKKVHRDTCTWKFTLEGTLIYAFFRILSVHLNFPQMHEAYILCFIIYIYYIHFHVLCTMRTFLSIQIVHKSRSSINVPISRKYPLVDRLRKRRRLVKIHSIRSLSNNYYACHLFRTKYNISSNVHFTFVHLPD